MKTTHHELIAGLDLGNTMIRVAIGKRCEEGIEIIGVGQSPSQGIRKGQIVTIESTASAIRKAVSQAERMAGCKVRNVVVGIADTTVRSQSSHGNIRIEQGRVREQDIRNVMQSARKIPLPPEHEILHAIPCEFTIDKQTRTSQPLGMTGATLEVTTHVITVASANVKNIVNACKLAGLKELDVVLQSLATAETMLLPEEREQGVVHIDFGGGPAKIAVYSKGALRLYTRSWLSGNKITEDVAVGLRISMLQAEQVKCRQGCCMECSINRDDMVEIELLKDKDKNLIPRQHMVDIIGGRTEEMFLLISRELDKSVLTEKMVAGAVITGGSSLLSGMKELASQILNMPVRVGSPRTIEGVVDAVSLPHHSTAVGLVLLGARADGLPQVIRVDGGNSLMFRATQAYWHLLRKFV